MPYTPSTNQTAFLLMDVQRANARYFAADGSFLGGNPAFLDHVEQALATARRAGLRVIHVAFCMRLGSPEVHPHNRLLAVPRISTIIPAPTDPQFHPRVAPAPFEVIVTRARVSAFHGSDLEVILRAGGIRHLVLCGLATSGVVLSTVCEAADRDYELTVLSDGCANTDKELERVLMEKLFPRYAQVMTIQTWSSSLG
jgi:nicotinamidase-related amidase